MLVGSYSGKEKRVLIDCSNLVSRGKSSGGGKPFCGESRGGRAK